MIKEFLGLNEIGWQVFLGNLFGAIAFHIIFFGSIAALYFLFGKKALNSLQEFADKLMKRWYNMEKIIQELNNKIKEIAQSEEIDTQKLTELINTRDRLKTLSITNVTQLQSFNTGFNRGLNVGGVQTFPAIGMHQTNSIYDSLMDVANVYLKNQAKQFEDKDKIHISIHDLIFYHNFVNKLENSHDMDTELERLDTKSEIEYLIMKELKTIIIKEKNRKKEENNTEKDEIIDTTPEDINKP